MDQVLLSRIQFAFTASYHFIFVPITIGIGLIMAIFVTRAFRSKNPEDDAIARMWVKIYTATFAIGVATGITMEFSFGTNWANYSRFVGDIFGAPLAAEALFAFFLESIFLGFIIFGRNKIRPAFYCASAWLTFAGSALSALWILIANSWMQTPAGAELAINGSEAVITDFFAAAFNASTIPRYTHTVLALLVMGAFVTIAVAAYYLHKNHKLAGAGVSASAAAESAQTKKIAASDDGSKAEVGNLSRIDASDKAADVATMKTGTVNETAARKMLAVGVVVGIIATCALLVSAHSSAVEVWDEQPTKMAMMEGLYETEAPGLAIVGYVDEENQETTEIGIPGGTSFLATGDFRTLYTGLNELSTTDQFRQIDVEDMPVNFVFQVYHIMVAMFGLIALTLLLALIFMRKKAHHNVSNMGWLQWLLMISPLFPFLAIQCGWLTAEVGRQPYVVYPANSSPDGVSLLTSQGTSVSVQEFELIISLVLFFAVYIMLFFGWVRVIGRFIKEGPVYDEPAAQAAADATDISFASIASAEDEGAPSKTTATAPTAASDAATAPTDAELDAALDEYIVTSNENTPDIEEGLVTPLGDVAKGGDEK